MISRGHSLIMGVSHTADTQADLYYPKTFALAAYELAPSLCIPPASKVFPSVARSAQQEDRASIFGCICILGAVVAGLIGGASLFIGIGYWFI